MHIKVAAALLAYLPLLSVASPALAPTMKISLTRRDPFTRDGVINASALVTHANAALAYVPETLPIPRGELTIL
jgi:hypothetical protein